MKTPSPPIAETKIFTLSASSLEENAGSGAASVMGVLDQANDVIFPGFWKDVLADFLVNGFVPVGHDWNGLPVAYPTKAEERGSQLYTEWAFHSTQAAQDARTVAKERIAAGKSMGLSVGFLCAEDGVVWFKNGQALLDYAGKQGCDLSLFDTTGLQAHKSGCRALVRCVKLYEFSIVAAPCNTQAIAAQIKGETAPMSTTSTTPLKNKPSAAPASVLNLSLRSVEGKTTLRSEGVDLKGEALGNVEQDASMAALRTVNSALMRVVYQTLYNPDETITTVEELLSGLPAAYDEARDTSVKLLQALLADVDIDDLRADLEYWYYYYSAPPGEQAALTFAQKAARLETDVTAFLTCASRRQETRVKSGRTLSRTTVERMQAIHDGLSAHCDSLKAMIDAADSTEQAEETDESNAAPSGDTDESKAVPDGGESGTAPPVSADVKDGSKVALADARLRELKLRQSERR